MEETRSRTRTRRITVRLPIGMLEAIMASRPNMNTNDYIRAVCHAQLVRDGHGDWNKEPSLEGHELK